MQSVTTTHPPNDGAVPPDAAAGPLISTVEKSTAIQPYCDITYSIVRHGDVNAIAPFYRLNASEEIGS